MCGPHRAPTPIDGRGPTEGPPLRVVTLGRSLRCSPDNDAGRLSATSESTFVLVGLGASAISFCDSNATRNTDKEGGGEGARSVGPRPRGTAVEGRGTRCRATLVFAVADAVDDDYGDLAAFFSC